MYNIYLSFFNQFCSTKLLPISSNRINELSDSRVLELATKWSHKFFFWYDIFRKIIADIEAYFNDYFYKHSI